MPAFPSSPTVGQVFQSWQWTGQRWDQYPPSGLVTSVNGRRGAVVMTVADFPELQTALDGKVAKAGDTMTGALTITMPATQLALNTTGTLAQHAAQQTFQRNGLVRWVMAGATPSTETGSNQGSNFVLTRCTDAGAGIDSPFWVRRIDGSTRANRLGVGVDPVVELNLGSTSNISTTVGVDATYGIFIRSRVAQNTNAVGFQYVDGGVVGTIVIASNQVVYNTTSDVRLKNDALPFTGGREIIDALSVEAFTWPDGTAGIGLMAQDAAPIYPPAVTPGQGEPGDAAFRPWSLDYSKYVPLILETLQDAFRRIDDLTARVTELENRIRPV